jgi:hypothetical protein
MQAARYEPAGDKQGRSQANWQQVRGSAGVTSASAETLALNRR